MNSSKFHARTYNLFSHATNQLVTALQGIGSPQNEEYVCKEHASHSHVPCPILPKMVCMESLNMSTKDFQGADSDAQNQNVVAAN
uniref:Uncharacterized protein n=1 Tax=Arundo donax TaxID=35708 RepID=A0A0A8ZXC8_ARUDO